MLVCAGCVGCGWALTVCGVCQLRSGAFNFKDYVEFTLKP